MPIDMTRYSASQRPRGIIGLVLLVIVALVLLVQGPFRAVPAGHVGVKDFFGSVSSGMLGPGINLVFPLTHVEKMSVQTQEIKEVAEVPSKEGLILYLETSHLFQLEAWKSKRYGGPNHRCWTLEGSDSVDTVATRSSNVQ